jgi:hypothetical protein
MPPTTTTSKTSLALNQLESHLWEAANILRGPVDAADFKTYVFPPLFFKRLSDVHDEEYDAALAESHGDEEDALFPQNYRFQVPEKCTHLSCAVIPRPDRAAGIALPRGKVRSQHRRPGRRATAASAHPHRARDQGPRHLRRPRGGANDMNARSRRPFSREQRTTIISGMLLFVLILVVLQLWLLTATMNAWRGGDDSIVWPGALTSLAALGLNVGLYVYLRRMERTSRGGA